MKWVRSDMEEDLTSSSMEAYEKPLSLWRLVEEVVVPEERPEIRDILGISLVEQSLELHEEVDNLLSIWQDYRVETDEDIPASPVSSGLPEPPGMRDNLRTHIRMLLECVREKAQEEGREVATIFHRHNSDVLDYVTDEPSRNSSLGMVLQRPSSSMSSRDGRDTPMRMTPSSDSDGMSGTSNISDQVDAVKDQLNILRIDEVAGQLRSTLEEEIAQLLRDSVFLQGCLEEESDFRCHSRMSTPSREPSIQELKEERNLLEKEFKAPPPPSALGASDPLRRRDRHLPNSPKRRLPSPLAPPSGVPGNPRLRPSPPSSAGLGGRPAPLKALHKPPSPVSSRPSSSSSSTTSPRRSSDSALSRTRNSPTAGLTNSRADSPGKPQSPVSNLFRAGDSPTLLRPSPPSSAKPPAGAGAGRGRAGSGRFRHRVMEAKQSR